MLWITIAFFVLLILLFSGITGILLFSLGVGWLFLNAMSIFLCMWLKLQMARGLEKCLARVNKLLLRHKIIIALDDRGNISCHKVHLCFIYFDAAQCIRYSLLSETYFDLHTYMMDDSRSSNSRFLCHFFVFNSFQSINCVSSNCSCV